MRGDRPQGLAESQLASVRAHCVYDVEATSDESSAAECAHEVILGLAVDRPPAAFELLRRLTSPAITTQNRACLSIRSFFNDIHNTSDQNGVATTD